MRDSFLRCAALAFLCVGCGGAMGMDRGEITRMERPEPAPPSAPVVDNAAVALELERRPQLPAYVRVAVYFRAPAPVGAEPPLWRWTHEDRRSVVTSGDELRDVEIFALSDALVTGTSLDELRVSAARHGADALLIVDAVTEQRTSDNGWLATYPLLLPILFAPANELETVFRARATLFDVRNGYLYLTAEGESEQTQQRAHIYIDRRGALGSCRTEAIGFLSEELKRRFERAFGVRDSLAPRSSSARPAPLPALPAEAPPGPGADAQAPD
jgi:hypothetical protein